MVASLLLGPRFNDWCKSGVMSPPETLQVPLTNINLLICGWKVLYEIWLGGHIHLDALFAVEHSAEPVSFLLELLVSVVRTFAIGFDLLTDFCVSFSVILIVCCSL
jgi:hypothetical protein